MCPPPYPCSQTNIFVLSPRRVTALAASHIVDAACGEAHTLAIDAAGALYTWGKGATGQLGTGLTVDSHWPVHVEVTLEAGEEESSGGLGEQASGKSRGVACFFRGIRSLAVAPALCNSS